MILTQSSKGVFVLYQGKKKKTATNKTSSKRKTNNKEKKKLSADMKEQE